MTEVRYKGIEVRSVSVVLDMETFMLKATMVDIDLERLERGKKTLQN